MADEGIKTGEEGGMDPVLSLKSELDAKLAEVNAQIQALNSSITEGLSSVITAVKPPATLNTEVDDDDFLNPKALKQKIMAEAADVSRQMLEQERQKNAVIFNLAQEYPEIQSDANMRKEILAAQRQLPKSMQDTADGYEMAVLKAVSRAGILPKSKRTQTENSDDFSLGGGRSSGSKQGSSKSQSKVPNGTVMFAELLRGRELTKEELQDLQKASERRDYGRYR